MVRKKIAFYIDTFNKGGTEKATLNLLNRLDTNKYDITLIRFFPEGEYNKYLRTEIKNKVRYPFGLLFKWNKKLEHRVHWWGRNFFDRISGKLAHKILIGDRYDIEVACGFYYPTKFISYSKKAKKISWVHMDYTIDKSSIGNFTKEEGQKFFGEMDKIVCVSHECEDKFNMKFDMKEKTVTRYNVVNTKEVIALSEKEKIECGNNVPVVVAMGRLTWQKGFDRLLEVHKELIDKGIHHRLLIIGEGEDYDKLSQFIKQQNLKETVELLGYKENPYPYLKAADLFVCSSRHESFSLVVAESIVLETPIISTSCTGPKELLENGKYGMIVENSVAGLSDGLEKMLTDKSFREDMKEKTRKRKAFFCEENLVQEWEDILDNL